MTKCVGTDMTVGVCRTIDGKDVRDALWAICRGLVHSFRQGYSLALFEICDGAAVLELRVLLK